MIELAQMADRVGEELSVSDWLAIDQARIDAFAACTGDAQWIHVDAARAAESPFGGTIAHGFLTLSLLASLGGQSWAAGVSVSALLNYGLDKVRFLAPVKTGARIRNRMRLLSVEEKAAGRTLLSFENTVEIDGEEKPAMVAVTLVMAFA